MYSPQFMRTHLGKEFDVKQYLTRVNTAYNNILGFQQVKVTPEVELELREQAKSEDSKCQMYEIDEIRSMPKFDILRETFEWNENDMQKVRNEFWQNYSGQYVEVNTHEIGQHH